MPYSEMQQELHAAAEFFTNQYERRNTDVLFELCAHCLKEVASSLSVYTKEVSISQDFFKDLADTVHHLMKEGEHAGKDVQAVAFQLFEDLAVVMREAAIAGALANNSVYEKATAFFEKSGHWLRNDQTLVSAMYYEKIPEYHNAKR